MTLPNLLEHRDASQPFDTRHPRDYPRAGVRQTDQGRYNLILWNTEDEPHIGAIEFKHQADAIEMGVLLATMHRNALAEAGLEPASPAPQVTAPAS